MSARRSVCFLLFCWAIAQALPAGANPPSESRFALLDADGNGNLTWDEFSSALPGMTRTAFDTIDSDSSGAIDLEEWNRFSSQHSKSDGHGMTKGMMPAPGMMKKMAMPTHSGLDGEAGNAAPSDSMPLVMPPTQQSNP